MTQRDVTQTDENISPPSTSANARRRSSSAAKAGSQSSPSVKAQPLAPVASSSFYGSNTGPPARPPLHAIRTSETGSRRRSVDSSHAMEVDVQPKESVPPPVGGIDLDADDNQFPNSPSSIEDDNYLASTIQYPDVGNMRIEGHGFLPNAILGHSSHPAFRFGSAFDWPETFDASSLVDYSLDTSFAPRPSPPRQAQGQVDSRTAPSQNTPQTTRSYSQALGSGSHVTTGTTQNDSNSPTVTSPTGQRKDSIPKGESNGKPSPANPFSNASLEQARPHPDAYYSVADQAWTVITSISKDVGKGEPAGPATGQCVLPHNRGIRKTHHYVRMPHGIDPRFILRPTQTEVGPALGAQGDLKPEPALGGPSAANFPNPLDSSHACWAGPPTLPRNCWDLFVCSGCRNAFAVSPANAIPSVLGVSLIRAFIEARLDEEKQRPQPLDSRTVVQTAVEYFWKVMRNVLYDNNSLGIPTAGTTFTKRMGKSSHALALFERLHFTAKTSQDGKAMLEPPLLTPNNLLLLSRAFLELSLWAASLEGMPAPNPGREVLGLIKLQPIDNKVQHIVGPDIVGKYVPSDTDFKNTEGFAGVYKALGVTPETADEDVVFAYQCQVETDKRHHLYYFDSLVELASLRGDQREVLQLAIATERSQDRFGYREIVRALEKLSLKPLVDPHKTFFGYPYSQWPNEDYIASAYQDRKDEIPKKQGSESDLKELKDAVELLAKALGSELLQVVLASASPAKPAVGDMTVDEAFAYLQVSQDTNDNVLCSAVSIMFFSEDTASEFQKEKARVALGVVAESRKSEGIRKFLDIGLIPEAIEAPREAPISVDRPTGLQNIGNTCYLNSLLQYFFTIKELRDVVLDFDKYQETRPFEEIENSKRVGGRNITRREIERSRKFTKLLSQLFFELIHSKVASIRPTHDLAYLALVSSKDEDMTTSSGSQNEAATSSEDTKGVSAHVSDMKIDNEPEAQTSQSVLMDAQSEEGLAAGQSANVSPGAKKLGSPSVLGKRTSDHFDEDGGQMDVDERPTVKIGSPEAMADSEQPVDDPVTSTGDMVAQDAENGVVEIVPESQARKPSGPSQQNAPPPLPPRTPSTSIAETNMMFGRQNDVSEAMDNVLFQIESALDDSKIPKTVQPPTLAGQPCSFVQSLFYGTTLQSLEFETEGEGKRVKEETFGYQLVDVAKDGKDLYDGLDAAFTPSIVDIEGKKAKRQDILTQLPPILQIQLQRVQFDRATARIYKSNAYMPFPQTLRMGRYLSPEGRSSEFAAKQSRSSELRSELTRLQEKLVKLEQKDEDQQTLPDILNNAAESLRQLGQSEDTAEDPFMQELQRTLGDNNEDVLALLSQHAGAIDKDILDAKQRLDACRREVEEIWSDDHENEYELSSVFIHLGAAGYGHYYLYQRALPHQPERWLKFNDESVTDVPVGEVFADTTGSTANPYWLTYVRKTEISQRIDAVCRNFI